MKKNFTMAAIGCLLAATVAQAANDEPITDVEGTVKTYTKTYTPWSYGMVMEEQNEEDFEIVFGDNGSVYFKDMMMPYDTYIEGQLKDDKIIVEVPQIDYNDGMADNFFNILSKVTPPEMFGDMAEVWYGLPETDTDEVKTIEFTVAKDGTITWENPEGAFALGDVPVPDYMGMGVMTAYLSLSFTPDEPVNSTDMISNRVVSSERLYDLNGRQIGIPSAAGVYIRVSTLNDGTRTSEKVFVK